MKSLLLGMVVLIGGLAVGCSTETDTGAGPGGSGGSGGSASSGGQGGGDQELCAVDRCGESEACYRCSSDDTSEPDSDTCGSVAVEPGQAPMVACHDRYCDATTEYCRIQDGWTCTLPVEATCVALPVGCDANALDCDCLEDEFDRNTCTIIEGALHVSFAVEGEG